MATAATTDSPEATPDTATSTQSPELTGLIANRDALLAEKKKLEKQLKQYEGIDPEQARKLKTEKEQAEIERLKAQGDFESLRKQLIEQHENEKRELQGRLEAKDRALYKSIVERDAIAAISAAGAPVAPLLPHVTQHLRAIEEDGSYVTRIVDSKDNPRIGDAKGNPMTLQQLLEEYKANPDFQRLFPASGNGGSGAPSQQANGATASKTMTRSVFDAMSPADKMAHVKAGGQVVDA